MTSAAPGPGLAVAWSGGKDSLLALHRAVRRGRRVTHLLNLYEASTGRVRFHGLRGELVEAQAEALGLRPVREASGDEGGFDAACDRALERLGAAGVTGVVFGNVHLADVREWWEERTTGRGLEHVEPLWGDDPAGLVREFLALGYRSTVVSVNLECGDPAWLGREVSPRLLERWVRGGEVDPCGEYGEYHTFAWDGPLFRHAVRARRAGILELEGHRVLDLVAAGPEEAPGEGGGAAETGGRALRPLRGSADIEALLSVPAALLYKHSNRCWVSRRALDQVRAFADRHPELPVWMVDVVGERRLAQALARRLEVRHASPQAILLRRGAAVWDASHVGVSERALARAAEALVADDRTGRGN